MAMSNLSDYLAKNGIKQRAFASEIGVDPSIVSRLARNEMTPSLQLAADIERATRGAVKAIGWVKKGRAGTAAVQRRAV